MYKLKYEISDCEALFYNIILLKKRWAITTFFIGNEIEEDYNVSHVILPGQDLYFEIMCESKYINEIKESIPVYILNGYYVFFEYFLEKLWHEQQTFGTHVNNVLEIIVVSNGLQIFINNWLNKKFIAEYNKSYSYQNWCPLLFICCCCLTLTKRNIPLPDAKFITISIEAYRDHKITLLPCITSCINEHLAYLGEKLSDRNVPLCLHLASILANVFPLDEILQLIKGKCNFSIPVGNKYWTELFKTYMNIHSMNIQSRDILLHILLHCPNFQALIDLKMLLPQRTSQNNSELYSFAVKNFFERYKISNDNSVEFLDNVLKCLQNVKFEDLNAGCLHTVENLIIEQIQKVKPNKFSHNLRGSLFKVIQSEILFLTKESNIEKILLLISQHQDSEVQKMLTKVLSYDKYNNFVLSISVCKAWLEKCVSDINTTTNNCETSAMCYCISKICELKSLKCVLSNAETLQAIDNFFDEWIKKWRLQSLFSTFGSLNITNDNIKAIEGSLDKLIERSKDYIKEHFDTLVMALAPKSSEMMTE